MVFKLNSIKNFVKWKNSILSGLRLFFISNYIAKASEKKNCLKCFTLLEFSCSAPLGAHMIHVEQFTYITTYLRMKRKVVKKMLYELLNLIHPCTLFSLSLSFFLLYLFSFFTLPCKAIYF